MGFSENKTVHHCTYDASCNFRTVHRTGVYRHIRKFHERVALPKRFHCPQEGCDHQSADSYNMKTHFNRKHKEAQKPEFPCPICPKILSSKCILEAHVSRHTGEFLYHYCDKCEFKTAHITAFNNHRNVKHLGLKMVARPKRFKCDKCNRGFPYKANLTKHMIVHSDEKPFTCTIPGCEFRTKYIKSSKEHEERHNSKRNFACPMCNKRFKTNYELNRHVLRIHTAEKTVKCDLCPYVTSLRTNLKSHQVAKHKAGSENDSNINSGNPKKLTGSEGDYDSDPQKRLKGYFYCDYPSCTFRTKTRYSIAPHKRRVHAQRRPHSCSICSKGFYNKASLVGHTRTHTGERPYKCPFCSYAATLHPNILRHVKFGHRDEIKHCKSLTQLTLRGYKALTDVVLSPLVPIVLLERKIFQFV